MFDAIEAKVEAAKVRQAAETLDMLDVVVKKVELFDCRRYVLRKHKLRNHILVETEFLAIEHGGQQTTDSREIYISAKLNYLDTNLDFGELLKP